MGLVIMGQNRKVRKSLGNNVVVNNLLKIQEDEGRAGRKDVGNTTQVILERS